MYHKKFRDPEKFICQSRNFKLSNKAKKAKYVETNSGNS